MQTYTFEYTVRHDDLDFMGIVGNAEWVTLLTRARIDLLDRINFPLSEMIKQKVGGVVSEMTVKYIKPAKFGTKLFIAITPTKKFDKGLVMHYSITNHDNTEYLSADVTLIFINGEGKPTSMPEPISSQLFAE